MWRNGSNEVKLNINPFLACPGEAYTRQKDGIEEMVFLIDDFGKMGEIYGSSKALAISYWT